MYCHRNKGREYLERKIVKKIRRDEGGGRVMRLETEKSATISDRAREMGLDRNAAAEDRESVVSRWRLVKPHCFGISGIKRCSSREWQEPRRIYF